MTFAFGVLKRPRRYALMKRRTAVLLGHPEDIFAAIYKDTQENEPGTPLPAGFLLSARLAPIGYTTVDDLDGATVAELCDAGFSEMESNAILAAVSTLTPAIP